MRRTGVKNMSISGNLRILRKKAGLTQIELAERLGVSIATLRRWEAGETAPSGTRIIELANLLEISPNDIVSDKENSSKPAQPLFTYPNDERSNGMLVFEEGGTRIELPPTEKGYEIFNRLVENLITRKKISTEDQSFQR
ncbi:MAG: helix-turn-helix domain-containing protein [Synergistaceae bacterium]|nr:helix-turn-helix domain-containing protein [Synergistaceae bacterium]MBQ6919248.1 helix-turn-helix domain-containing protein [Synergistaceae bacterium]MBQ7267775.1 helix-turn-helix domain-containing protein [Synergistaceae bacterium]